jgi:hypothetical protein
MLSIERAKRINTMSNKTTNEKVNDLLNVAETTFTAPEIPDGTDTDSPVALVDAAIEAAESELNDATIVASEYSEDQLNRFRKLFQFPSIPDFGSDKAKAIGKLREWAKAQSEDGLAYVAQRSKSIVNFAYGLVSNPDEMADCSSEDGKLKIAFKATLGMERTVIAALEALTTESTKSIEKTWWSALDKGFKVGVNGVGKLADGQPISTVTSGQFTGKTVDTTGRLRRAILHLNRCAVYLRNGRDADALGIYLLLTGNKPTAEGSPDFFFVAADVIGAVQARLFGLASRDAKDLASQYEKELKEGKTARIKTEQEEASLDRDEERQEEIKKSLERQRNAPRPGQVPTQPIPTGKQFVTWVVKKDKDGNETGRDEVYRGDDGKKANEVKAKAKGNGVDSMVETVYLYN